MAKFIKLSFYCYRCGHELEGHENSSILIRSISNSKFEMIESKIECPRCGWYKIGLEANFEFDSAIHELLR